MLTPKFSLSQDTEFVYIYVRAPYIKLSETEIFVDDDEFRFYSQPYYLRLHLPGKIQEDQKASSQYDVDTGQLTIRLTKQTKSEHFEGLDLLTKLLTPKQTKEVVPEIEVLSKIDSTINEVEEEEETWYIEQNIVDDTNEHISGPSYGFGNRKSNCLNHITLELPDLIDLRDPDTTSQKDRRSLREQQELNLFNCEHYLADFFECDIIQDLILHEYKQLTGVIEEQVIFSEKENEKLLHLPRREYIIDPKDVESTYLGLVDLMLAYAYNFRFSNGENGIESDWTISKLSCMLSWLDSFNSIKDVVVSFARRSLIFPLYRNWILFEKVFSDVKTIFQAGKNQILKCLLNIHSILSESETKHPLNDLYITDYCVWIQSVSNEKIKYISDALNNLIVQKSDMNLKLEEMELEAITLLSKNDDELEAEDLSKLMKVFNDVVIVKNDSFDSDDGSSESESEDSSTGNSSNDDSESDDELSDQELKNT